MQTLRTLEEPQQTASAQQPPARRGPFGGTQSVAEDMAEFSEPPTILSLDSMLANPLRNGHLPEIVHVYDRHRDCMRDVRWTDPKERSDIRRTALALAQQLFGIEDAGA